MIRVLIYLVILAALAFGLSQIAEMPGVLRITWPAWPLYGKTLEMRPLIALVLALAILIAFYGVVSLLRFVFRIPSIMSFTARARRQNKGVAAVSRGMIAAGAGDARSAERASREALKLLGPTPLALLLQAQAAQLSGNRNAAEEAFKQMTANPETRVIGLRGLYLEARRDSDEETAFEFASQAHAIAPLPWAGQAMIERHAMRDDWVNALSVVEANIARKAVDKPTGNRQRAVLKTAIGLSIGDREPDEALQLAREAIKLAPDLTPAYVLAGRMLARKGDIRRGARILETGWKASPHPDIAAAYIDLRPGDSTSDRLARAQTLARLHSGHIESRLMLARAALDARNFDIARQAIAPLVEQSGARPTVRTCLLMADLEETEHGASGNVREWLARATRAPRDPMWIADGVASDTWGPASPVTGKLDAFVWEAPTERLSAPPPHAAEPAEETQKYIPPIPPKGASAPAEPAAATGPSAAPVVIEAAPAADAKPSATPVAAPTPASAGTPVPAKTQPAEKPSSETKAAEKPATVNPAAEAAMVETAPAKTTSAETAPAETAPAKKALGAAEPAAPTLEPPPEPASVPLPPVEKPKSPAFAGQPDDPGPR